MHIEIKYEDVPLLRQLVDEGIASVPTPLRGRVPHRRAAYERMRDAVDQAREATFTAGDVVTMPGGPRTYDVTEVSDVDRMARIWPNDPGEPGHGGQPQWTGFDRLRPVRYGYRQLEKLINDGQRRDAGRGPARQRRGRRGRPDGKRDLGARQAAGRQPRHRRRGAPRGHQPRRDHRPNQAMIITVSSQTGRRHGT
jgi:hypothetical protein